MKNYSLDQYEKRPEAMDNYLSYYGWNFNKKMCDFAISKIYKNGKKVPQMSKQQIDDLLTRFNIKLENDILYNKVYVYHMLYADFFSSSIIDDRHLAMAIKDYLDDEDGYKEIAFSRFYIDCVKKGIPIDWDEML